MDQVVTSLLGGAAAGAVAKTAIAPLDLTKINFQIEKRPFSFRQAYYFIKDNYNRLGIFSLWRGNSATLVRVVPSAAINYTAHEQLKRLFHVDTFEGKRKHPHRSFIAGSLSGVISTTATYPLDLVRARMAVVSDANNSIKMVLQNTYREGGIRGLYRGYTATVIGVIPYSGTGYFVYETLKRLHHGMHHLNQIFFFFFYTNISLYYQLLIVLLEFYGKLEPSPTERFICGAIAGAFAQTASYPLDIVRRRMQTKKVYHSISGTLYYVWSREGIIGGLYKGLSLNWVKGPIAVGISFTTFDLLTKFLRDLSFYTNG